MMMPGFGKRVDVPGGRRRARRQPVLLSASALTLGGSQSVIVEDVCATGARLRGRNLPPNGRQLVIRVGAVDVLASVAWRASEECGITFDTPLDQEGVDSLRFEGRFRTVLGVA